MCDLPEARVKQLLSERDTIIDHLTQKIELLTQKIKNLEHRLLRYENAHTPPSRRYRRRELIPDDQKKRPGQKEGHPGVTRPVREPDETIPVQAMNCMHCGKRLGEAVSYDEHMVEEIPAPVQARLTRYLLGRYVCGHCGEETLAANPDGVGGSRFGKNLHAQAAVMKYGQRLPYRKIAEALLQRGINLSSAAVLGMVGRTAHALRGEYDLIQFRIRQARVVCADETSIRVDGKTWWIWVFVTITDVLVVVADNRGGDVVKSVLGHGFRGTIICDGWKSYSSFTSRIQRCWAHLLREADYVADRNTGARKLADALHRMYDYATTTRENNPRARRLLWAQMMRWMGIWLGRRYRPAEVKKFVQKVRNGGEHWFTFILNPEVEPTNNRAERALRESVVQRKIMGTLRNTKGTFAHETIMSCFATWEARGLDVYEELGRLL